MPWPEAAADRGDSLFHIQAALNIPPYLIDQTKVRGVGAAIR